MLAQYLFSIEFAQYYIMFSKAYELWILEFGFLGNC